MLENIQNYIWLIVFLPFLGFAVNLFFGRFFGKKIVGLVACLSVFLAFLISVAAFIKLYNTNLPLEKIFYTWIRISENFSIDFALRIDHLSVVMILVVSGVGFLIHVYSIGYMHTDKLYHRYFAFLNLFTGFMLLLVLANNILLMFVGWEGVGLCSYLLIGFWFEKKENAIAGMKAFIVNRIGDFGFTVGMLLLFVYLGTETGVWTLDFEKIKDVLHHPSGEMSQGILTAVGILLFVGACGKSAQIPLYVWLPDAMAGPTPVSALIHAATMVTAGVYIVARMNFLYVMAPIALTVVAVVGATTLLFSATIGLAQNDIKKVLAYSTVSQIGYMFLAVGVGAFAIGIFHLMTHAFFKACLFLGSGSVIHGAGGEQDIRKMGGLKKFMPITFWTFLIATVAIAGIPPFAGFFSKDEILWKAYSTDILAIKGLGKFLWLIGAVAAGFTAFYMFRLVFKTFYGELKLRSAGHHSNNNHSSGHAHGKPHESPVSMTIPLIILAILSIVGGFVGIPHSLGGGANFEKFTEPVFAQSHGEVTHPTTHSEPAEYILMAISIAVAVLGIFVAWLMYIKKPDLPAILAEKFKQVYNLILNKYWVDEIYQAIIVTPLVKFNSLLGKFDNFVIDGAVNGSGNLTAFSSVATGYADNFYVDGGVNGTADFALSTGRNLRKIQTGQIRSYITIAIVGMLFIIFILDIWLMREQIGAFINRILAII